MARPQYPISLNVDGQPCLVVGGGEVAARKAGELLRCGAAVTVVAPDLCAELEALAAAGTVTVRRRPVADDDLHAMFIVVAATDDQPTNERVSSRAREEGALVNVVDQPALCQFTAPAVVRRGMLTIAISTNGASPALSKTLRGRLATLFGPEWADVVDVMGAFRTKLLERHPASFDRRRDLMTRACTLDLAAIVREQGRHGLEARLTELLAQEGAA